MTERIRVKYPSVLYSFLLLLIFLFSFLNFSYRFYPLLNADMAINVLMAPGYHLPDDLYAWGQDRGGTLIPLLSNLLYRMCTISPVSAVSVVHYMILILGFLAASSFYRSATTRIFLAVIWFFPPWHFIDFVLFPLGTQFSLFMAGIWFLQKTGSTGNRLLKHLMIAMSCILMILGTWVSELGILMIIVLLCMTGYQAIRQLS